jgi:glycosyltransferase involved in cell wall biosynthesis
MDSGMRIGFDAKRALNNFTGLGNHARILLNAMMRDFPENDYLLFSPKATDDLLHQLDGKYELYLPKGVGGGLWRSWDMTRDLLKKEVRLYHGLSNELPFNIHKTDIKAVVTIHDLIFLKHTEQYPFIDRQIYTLKTKYAAKHAHKIIAVSQETKRDLMNFYKVPEEKIEVIYPSVDAAFQKNAPADFSVLAKYNLPDKYILNVGSFFPRKNQLKLIEAYRAIKDDIEEKLVLVGSDGSMKAEAETFIAKNKMEDDVKIISGVSNDDMPALYQKASLFVFPSLFEGFGAPVLEALFSKVPVIASKGGAIEEAAGPNSVLVNPNDAGEIGAAMLRLLQDEVGKKQREEMTAAGYIHAQSMTDKIFAEKTMQVYREVL